MKWRPIPGIESYEASACGKIRPTNPRYKNGRGAEGLRPWIVDRHGRLSSYVSLHVDGKRTKWLVHRLVAMAWHGLPPADAPDCAHLNGNALDNRAANLQWLSHSENIKATWAEDAEEIRIETRCRWEDALGFVPAYLGPERGSEVPF
jgi:hypothetical protein